MGLFGLFKKNNSSSPEKLIKAARKGNLEAINFQLANGADVNSRDEKGRTPLMWVSSRNDDNKLINDNKLIKILLEKGADINAKDIDGKAALMYASVSGRVETVKMLIEAGADINTKDKEGRTALIHASNDGWIETVKMLMEAGTQIDDKDKNEVLTLINGPALPLPEVQPPLPEFARKHDLCIAVEVEKKRMELVISADKCTVNWGDSDENEYNNIKEKNISHRYAQAGNYIITVNATGLSRFECYYIDAKVTAIYLNNCPQLEWLNCSFNKLTSLDISRCTALTYLSCLRNKLTSLDLSNNLALDYLYCGSNLLTCLDISNNTLLMQVDCSGNQLSILNVSRNNSTIARLMCNNNQLSKNELNRIFNQLPNYNSSYGTVNSWYAGSTSVPTVFIACGNNPGFNSCNRKIIQNKNWLVWKKAMYVGATLAGTPGRWQEDHSISQYGL
ncbi:MAG: ankyrin repeat domain-containing protein [Prevotellaceae bacterium]|jgi:hypothetical protein|nr:ankyrin repeat domain-containing protein [Prevotellaceae bacterium]